jgi:hypothetical protein
MKEKFLYIVLILFFALDLVSCTNHEENKPYYINVINKYDKDESRVVVIYNGKTSMPMRQNRHGYYLTLKHRDLSDPNSKWSGESVTEVNAEIYEKYELGKTYKINGHTHIEAGDSVSHICWRTL